MSKSIVYGDDGSGTNWPVPNENVSNLRRTLRSNKPEVHFHLGSELETSPVSFETKHSIEPRLSLVDRQLIAEAEDLNQSVQISFDQGNTDHILDDLAAVTESDNDVELNDNGDQNVLHNEINDGVNDEVNMAEERTLLPNPFRGAPDEDASEFWRRLENYCTYKGHDAANKLRLAKAMLVESSCDWLENLPDEKKNSFQNLETAFKERYVKPSILRYRSAREIFDRKQAPDESVESYVNRLQSLNKKVDVGQETLLYAFLSGLKPPIASFVMGKNPANFPEAVDAARIAEFSTVEGSSKSDQQLFDQMSEVRRDIQRLAQRYDSMSLTASVQSDGDKRTPERKVTFQEPRQRSVSPKPNMFQCLSHAHQCSGVSRFRRKVQDMGRRHFADADVILGVHDRCAWKVLRLVRRKVNSKLADKNVINADEVPMQMSCTAPQSINSALAAENMDIFAQFVD